MNIDDLLVEVRSSSLERVGTIQKDDLALEAEIPFNGVGTWTVTISLDHALASALSSPGAGIVVTNLVTGEVMFSGPAIQPEQARSTENLAGFITIQGITDEHVLDDALAWPDPINGDAAGQTTLQDSRSGAAETVVHGFVNANIGPAGPSNRRNARLYLDTDEGRGAVVTQTARFDKLLTLCQNLAAPDGLGFRVRQNGSRLKFETFMPRDQRRLVRLSLENDGIANSRVAQGAPVLTRALVVGKPGASGTPQVIAEVATPESLQAETVWNRRIESFVDQQDTVNTDVLQRSGQEALKDGGYTSINARFEPTETFRASYGHEWDLGDLVTVESGGESYTAPVTALIFKVDADSGYRLGAILGDPTAFNEVARLSARLEVAATPPTTTRPPVVLDPLEDALAENDAALAQLALDLAANEEALEVIGTTANGKNSVRYETFAPTTQANAAGDIWYVRNTTTNRITAQYEGMGGTSWRSLALTNVVVTSLDAGAITTGTLAAERIASTAINASNITSGTINANNVAIINLNASNITTGTLSASRISGGTITGTSLQTWSGATADGVSIGTGGITWYNSTSITAFVGSSGSATFASVGSNGGITANGEVAGATLLTSSPPETGATDGYAVRMGSGGRINKVTSSRRYKENETDAALDVSTLLQLQPKRYTRIATGRSEIGFVAEDADDLGLDDWVLRNEDGSVESFAYDAWGIALQAIVRRQAQQIADLQAAVESLQAA